MSAPIIVVTSGHMSLGAALFQLFGIIAAVVWCSLPPSRRSEKREKKWADYAKAHPNRNNKAGDPLL